MSCTDCFRGGRATGNPTGSITTIHGLKTYVAAPPAKSTSSSTIIIFTDAFGLGLVNNKLIADSYSLLTGFRVLVPEVIPGGGMSPDVMPVMDIVLEPVAPFWNIWGQARRAFNLVKALSHFIPFMIRAHPPKAFPTCLEFARKVKAELPAGAKLGVAGFCWGGYHSLHSCMEPAVQGTTERLVDAQFCAHPSLLKIPGDIVDAVSKFKTPVSIALGDQDYVLKPAQLEEEEAVLRTSVGEGNGQNGVFYEFKVYKGPGHGFAVRAKPESDVEAKAADEAKDQAVEWFKRWL